MTYKGQAGGFDLTGTGMPNGVINARPGVYYTDTVGTNGAWRWLKKSGTGSTGWEVVHGDTGVRNIASLLEPTWKLADVGGVAKLWRTNDAVHLGVRVAPMGGLIGVNGNLVAKILEIPTGFRDKVAAYLTRGIATLVGGPNDVSGIIRNAYSIHTVDVALNAPATLYWTDPMYIHFYISWTTTDPWPTTLPGTPA